jgi:hypothetical protein
MDRLAFALISLLGSRSAADQISLLSLHRRKQFPVIGKDFPVLLSREFPT